MALNVPENAVDVDKRVKVDINRELITGNPFLRNSWLGALATGVANRLFDFYFALRQAEKEAIPDTAVVNLTRWAAIWRINKLPATSAKGNIVFQGSAGATIPFGTTVVTSDGKEYKTQTADILGIVAASISTITRVGSTATVTMVEDHNIASNVLPLISGADQAEYNLSFPAITVTGAKTFEYQVTGTPADGSGTMIATWSSANILAHSVLFDEDENQDADAIMTLQSPIGGITDEVRVDQGAMISGSDEESDTSLRARLLEKIQNPVANFNVSDITSVAKAIAGVTRVWVQEITPGVGSVTVYFMRDNDDSAIPDGAEVAEVKTAVDAIKPATSDTSYVFVLAPIAEAVDFTFTDLQPATATMQDAVEASLEQFFSERTNVGVDIDADAYRAAIYNTVDPLNGDTVTTFTLSAPAGDVTIAATKIGTLGNITMP